MTNYINIKEKLKTISKKDLIEYLEKQKQFEILRLSQHKGKHSIKYFTCQLSRTNKYLDYLKNN